MVSARYTTVGNRPHMFLYIAVRVIPESSRTEKFINSRNMRKTLSPFIGQKETI